MKKLAIITGCVLMSCANIVPPTGGANDTIAPKIVSTFPENKTINFKGNQIVFEFDEFVNLNDPQNNIEIYPIVKKREKIIGKKLHFFFEEPLKENTTYLIAFNDAIKDFREGNAMPNSEYTFSTGNVLDTGYMEGFVLGAEMKNTLKDITCVAAENKDSFLHEKYLMKTRTNENGAFNLKALKQKKGYYLFCFNDINKDKKWTKDEDIGFAKEPFTTESRPKILLNETKALQKLIRIDNSYPGALSFLFDAKPEKAEINFDTLKTKIVGHEKIDKTIKVYYDTIAVSKDKVTIKAKELKEEVKQVKIVSEAGRGYALRKQIIKRSGKEMEITIEEKKPLEIEWSYPIKQVDTSKMMLLQEAVVALKKDIQINQSKMILRASLTDGKKYKLILLDSAVQNIFNQYSKKDTIAIAGKKKQIPGSIAITITDLDENKAYILFNQENKNAKKQLYPFTGKKQITITQKNILPDEYLYYLVEDENKNGQWDKGNFEQNVMPENVYLILKQQVASNMDFIKTLSLNKIRK